MESEMTDEEAVLAAARRFYDALEAMMSGSDVGAMDAAWHHTPRVTSSHPLGDWAYGWDEVAATWAVFGAMGRPELAGSRITELRAWIYGDVAYTTCVFHTTPKIGDFKLNCTDIFHRVDGVWKVIHHHPDKDRGIGEALQKIAESD